MAKPPSARVALGVLTGVNLLNYVDRYIPAAILPLLMTAFGVSDTKGGLVHSVFIWSYTVVSPVVGILGDRGQKRFVIAGVGVLIWSATTFASGLAPSFFALLIARALIGVGEASYSVVTPSLLGDYYPVSRRGRAMAIFYSAIPVGSAIGFAVGGMVGSHFGWRWAFFVAGLPGLLLGLLLFAFRDPQRGPAVTGISRAEPERPTAARTLHGYPSFVFNVAGQTIYTFALGGLAAWMPTYFSRVRGLPLGRASLIFGAITCVAGFVGTLLGGQLSDRLARRWPAAAFVISGIGLVLSAPFTVLALLSPLPAVFWPALFVTLTLLFLNTGPLNAAIANVLPPELRTRGFGANTFAIHLLGDGLSPFLIGMVSGMIGLRIPVLAAGLMLPIAGLVLLAGRRSLQRDLAITNVSWQPTKVTT